MREAKQARFKEQVTDRLQQIKKQFEALTALVDKSPELYDADIQGKVHSYVAGANDQLSGFADSRRGLRSNSTFADVTL